MMGQDTLWLPSSVENVNVIWLKILKRSVHITAAQKCPRGGQYSNRKVHVHANFMTWALVSGKNPCVITDYLDKVTMSELDLSPAQKHDLLFRKTMLKSSEDEDVGESCKNERKEESDEDDTDLFEDISVRLRENLNIERETAQSESSFNSNTVRPEPDVDENVNLDLSVASESESEDENMAVYDDDTELDDGADVDLVVDLDQHQQNYDSGQWQKNIKGFPKLPRFSAQPGIKVALFDDPSPLKVYKLFITDELINSWKVSMSLN
ncbi:hypothetical protein PoB_002403300 [Plakobranchus ocellatus]|uniref:Uncharacterized protein n=1 Tax=Plakobranchus ocellatus TaxID=259542 RepID=A0AAV3ZSP0_9GAST|nr:hypothetical protein PoB_002403300 [Plakobranchus ocellatus]